MRPPPDHVDCLMKAFCSNRETATRISRDTIKAENVNASCCIDIRLQHQPVGTMKGIPAALVLKRFVA